MISLLGHLAISATYVSPDQLLGRVMAADRERDRQAAAGKGGERSRTGEPANEADASSCQLYTHPLARLLQIGHDLIYEVRRSLQRSAGRYLEYMISNLHAAGLPASSWRAGRSKYYSAWCARARTMHAGRGKPKECHIG